MSELFFLKKMSTSSDYTRKVDKKKIDKMAFHRAAELRLKYNRDGVSIEPDAEECTCVKL